MRRRRGQGRSALIEHSEPPISRLRAKPSCQSRLRSRARARRSKMWGRTGPAGGVGQVEGGVLYTVRRLEGHAACTRAHTHTHERARIRSHPRMPRARARAQTRTPTLARPPARLVCRVYARAPCGCAVCARACVRARVCVCARAGVCGRLRACVRPGSCVRVCAHVLERVRVIVGVRMRACVRARVPKCVFACVCARVRA